jgi:hypothetical protein
MWDGTSRRVSGVDFVGKTFFSWEKLGTFIFYNQCFTKINENFVGKTFFFVGKTWNFYI